MRSMQSMQSMPYATPFAEVSGFPQNSAEASRAAAASLAALSPAGFMAPNYVYNYRGQQYVTNVLTSAPVMASCDTRPTVCADAVTRGLLSGLQPLLTGSESLFPEDQIYYHAARRV
jgi:hypothetical protein